WRIEPLAHGRLRVASVMRLNVKKRPQDLVAMVPRIKRQLPSELQPLFTIVGDGPVRRRLERQAARLGVAGDIEFRGFLSREKIREIFAETDVFVLPTEHEAFGIAVLEARCAGLPVVARSGCGVADIIEHGRHGYLAHDRRQMADYIAQLLREADTRRNMRAAAGAGLERFGWDAVIARHLDEYREALAEASAQRGQRLSA
ncbi:MAG TPA: glycosyltransferase, partial [Pirellulales bacterium]|nr:glycosyltransferase [Pirellulales bacterium]